MQWTVTPACFPWNRFANFLTAPLTASNINTTHLMAKSHSCKIHILSGVRFLPRSMRRAWRSCNSHVEFMNCTRSHGFSNLKTHRKGFFIRSSIPSFIQLTVIPGLLCVFPRARSWLRLVRQGGVKEWVQGWKLHHLCKKKSYRNIALDHNIEAMLNPRRLQLYHYVGQRHCS